MPAGLFVTVLDLYQENEPSHQWVEQLQVSVQLLSIPQYHSLFQQAGFVKVKDRRLLDPVPIAQNTPAHPFPPTRPIYNIDWRVL